MTNSDGPAAANASLIARRVEHVVVLMLENRSFDHMLGFLKHPYPDCFGQADLASFYNEDESDQPYVATSGGLPDLTDPDHSPGAIATQVGAYGTVTHMGGFVANYSTVHAGDGPKVMKCLDPATKCPNLAWLATHYAVCTRWFSSVPGETWPNRNFAHAATSDHAMAIEFGFYSDPTIFELFEKAGATWRIYYDGPPQVMFFKQLWKPRWKDLLPWTTPRIANWFQMDAFFEHAAADDLPAYTFIEPAHNRLFSDPLAPRQTNSQHCHNNFGDPSSADFTAGEALIGAIYNALADQPELFAKTLLLITYDEHGGLCDHIVPPVSEDPGDPKSIGLIRRISRAVRKVIDAIRHHPTGETNDFSRLGVRVPSVLVSPWIPPGTVIDRELEHASIPATLRSVFAPSRKPLTRRDRDAATFHDVVDETTSSVVRGCGPSGPAPRVPDADASALRERSNHRLPGDRHGAPADPAAFTPTATTFDQQLERCTTRAGQRLKVSRRAGVLSVGRARRRVRPAPDRPLGRAQAAPGPAAPGSPLEVFDQATADGRALAPRWGR